jgi:2-polyprenyl-3-methyl-5-hydroxy-6-metoxy-1,4-benzoquinol methylase
MTGDFTEKQSEQQSFFSSHSILPRFNALAFDLGAGHGLQSVSLAKLGFTVTAVDFNPQLLQELERNRKALSIQIVQDDFLHFLETTRVKAELIVCMGDTLTHLEITMLLEQAHLKIVSSEIINRMIFLVAEKLI